MSGNPLIRNSEIKEYKEIFKLLDKNNRGKISISLLLKIRKIFFPISQTDIKKIINKIDISNVGEFSFNNFLAFIQKQKEYFEKNDEKTILKSLKEEIKTEFLGHKRRREKTNRRENLETYNNKNYNNKSVLTTEKEKEEQSDDATSFISNFLGNNNKKKYKYSENEPIYKTYDEEINKNNIYRYKDNSFYNYNSNTKSSESHSIFFQNDKKKKENKNKRKDTTKKDKFKNKLAPIIIYKKDLPPELIRQISHKSNDISFPLIKIENNESNLNNFISIDSNTDSFSKKVHLSQNNSSDFPIPFTLESNNTDSCNNSLISFNSKVQRNQKILSKKKNKEITDYFSSNKLNEEKNQKIYNNNFNFNQYQYNTKFNYIEDYERDLLDEKSIKSENDKSLNFLKKDNNMENINYMNKNNYLSISNCKLERSINNIDNNMTNKKKKNENIKSKIFKYHDRPISQNIQVLSDFLLRYKRNKKNEIIVKKRIEIPYSIIIDKKVLKINNNIFSYSNSVKRENNYENKINNNLNFSQVGGLDKEREKKYDKMKTRRIFKSEETKKNNKNTNENNQLSYNQKKTKFIIQYVPKPKKNNNIKKNNCIRIK